MYKECSNPAGMMILLISMSENKKAALEFQDGVARVPKIIELEANFAAGLFRSRHTANRVPDMPS